MKSLALLITLLAVPACSTPAPLTADEQAMMSHVKPGAQSAFLELYRYRFAYESDSVR